MSYRIQGHNPPRSNLTRSQSQMLKGEPTHMVSTGGSRIKLPRILRDSIARRVATFIGSPTLPDIEISFAEDAALPTSSRFIFACNYADRDADLQVAEVLSDAFPQLKVEAAILPPEPAMSAIPTLDATVSKDWKKTQDRLNAGMQLVIFPEAEPSPDGLVHKGERSIGWLALTEKLLVVPLGLSLPERRLTIGHTLDFSRFHDLSVDRSLTRAVTDEVMTELVELSGLGYSDTYAHTANVTLNRKAKQKAAAARQAARRRRQDQREAQRRRLEEAAAERVDLERRARLAEEEAREHSRRAAAAENSQE